jgi:hypothetical protein
VQKNANSDVRINQQEPDSRRLEGGRSGRGAEPIERMGRRGMDRDAFRVSARGACENAAEQRGQNKHKPVRQLAKRTFVLPILNAQTGDGLMHQRQRVKSKQKRHCNEKQRYETFKRR